MNAATILTICSYCRAAKLPDGSWSIEWPDDIYPVVVDGRVSHGACPECFEREVANLSTSRGSASGVLPTSVSRIAGTVGAESFRSVTTEAPGGSGLRAAATDGGQS